MEAQLAWASDMAPCITSRTASDSSPLRPLSGGQPSNLDCRSPILPEGTDKCEPNGALEHAGLPKRWTSPACSHSQRSDSEWATRCLWQRMASSIGKQVTTSVRDPFDTHNTNVKIHKSGGLTAEQLGSQVLTFRPISQVTFTSTHVLPAKAPARASPPSKCQKVHLARQPESCANGGQPSHLYAMAT